jgi:hypothetical protein
LQALCACKISAWNEEYTSGMLPIPLLLRPNECSNL